MRLLRPDPASSLGPAHRDPAGAVFAAPFSGRGASVAAMRAWILGWLVAGAVLAQEWRPLFDGRSLAGWRVTEFAGHGDVEVEDGVLILNQGQITGVTWTNEPPKGDYEIELEARRELGSDFFCGLTFPVGDRFCTWIVGGWGGAVVGLSSIDGADAANNTTTRVMKFETDRWYRFRLRVTSARITAWIDDEEKFAVDIAGKDVDLRPGDIYLSKPLGIASYNTRAGLRNIRWRPLGTSGGASATDPSRALRGSGGVPAVLPAGMEPVPPRETSVAAARRLVEASVSGDFAWQRLAELCDRFGPRFSGTTNLESAIDWILDTMRADGLENVRGEPVKVPRWIRGREKVTLVGPGGDEELPMLGLGGSIGTPPGGITAPVLVVTNFAELEARADEARGRIVVFDVPFTRYGETVRYRFSGAIAASRAGAVASVIRSVGSFGLRTPHTGGIGYSDEVPRIPHAALAAEDTARLRRWQERGVTPVLRLEMEARTEPDTTSRNVVAEWRGWQAPDEVVVVGGHVDSWDVGRGALDDGGGCLAAWEVLRLMRQLELRPRRTIRCVLWTNEENGLRGARAYRDAHRDELDRHLAAIESDNGAFDPVGFGFTGSDRGLAVVLGIAGLLEEWTGAGRVTLGGADADTGPLLEGGVPVLGLRVEDERYMWFHHTDADTPERVDPGALARCAGSLAAMAFLLADSPVGLPR